MAKSCSRMFAALAVFGPAGQPVFVAMFAPLVADLDAHFTVGIAGVLFFHPQVARRQVAADRLIRKVHGIPQVGIEGYANLIPVADLPFRLIVDTQLSTFEVTKVTDVMHRLIGAHNAQGFLASGRKSGTAGK